MKHTKLQLDKYDTDKITNCYLNRYDQIFESVQDKKVILLELGILNGGSLLLWRDYFPNGSIVGIDLNLPKEFKDTERIHIYEGSQADTKFLSDVANEIATEGFDIIIDDASHIGELTKVAFWHLFDNHLKPNGLYIIEDWGTGYWDDWCDGKSLNLESYSQSPLFTTRVVAKSHKRNLIYSMIDNIKQLFSTRMAAKSPMRNHSYGMVGFIKQLVDEQGAGDVSRKNLAGKPIRGSKFESITIFPSIVIVKKN
ncbi:MAG: hypothetical protein WCI92_10075 [Bacteroidota bacterium]